MARITWVLGDVVSVKLRDDLYIVAQMLVGAEALNPLKAFERFTAR